MSQNARVKPTVSIASWKIFGRFWLVALAVLCLLPLCRAQQIPVQAPTGGIAEIYASGAQRKVGDVYIADQNVDITYGNMRLQADHVEYNSVTYEAMARGNV